MALAMLARRPRRGCRAVGHPAAPWVDKAAPRHPRRNPSYLIRPPRAALFLPRIRPPPLSPWPPSSTCSLSPPPPRTAPGASPSSASSSPTTTSSSAAPHRRDRRIFLANGRRCPTPDLPHRSSSATPVAPSAPPVSSSPHSPYLPLDLLAVGRRSTVVAACSR